MRSSPYNPRSKSSSISDDGAMSTLMESTYKYTEYAVRVCSNPSKCELEVGQAIEVLGIEDGVAKSVEDEKAGKRARERRNALNGTTSSGSIDSERVEAARLAADRVSTHAAFQGRDRTTYLSCPCNITSRPKHRRKRPAIAREKSRVTHNPSPVLFGPV